MGLRPMNGISCSGARNTANGWKSVSASGWGRRGKPTGTDTVGQHEEGETQSSHRLGRLELDHQARDGGRVDGAPDVDAEREERDEERDEDALVSAPVPVHEV